MTKYQKKSKALIYRQKKGNDRTKKSREDEASLRERVVNRGGKSYRNFPSKLRSPKKT